MTLSYSRKQEYLDYCQKRIDIAIELNRKDVEKNWRGRLELARLKSQVGPYPVK